jgi:hypothetical protein
MSKTKKHDWDVKFFTYMTPFSYHGEEINILQIGCTDHFNIPYLQPFLLKNPKSQLYSVHFCNGDDDHSILQIEKELSKQNKDKQIHLFHENSYSFLIDIAKKEKIIFDIIIIYDHFPHSSISKTSDQDIFSQLILSWNLLKNKGLLFIYQTEDQHTNIIDFQRNIRLFTELKETNMEILEEANQYIFIRKKETPQLNTTENIQLEKILNRVLSSDLKQKSFTLPKSKLKLKDLQFELETSDQPVENMTKYGFIKEYDEYEDYLIHNKDQINSLDPKYMLLIESTDKKKINLFYKNLKNINIKINKDIKQILQTFLIKKLHKIYSFIIIFKNSILKKKISIINLSKFNLKSNTLEGFNEFVDTFPNLNIILYKPYNINKNINIKSTKNIKYIKCIDDNYSYKNLESILLKINSKIDIININITHLIKNKNTLKEYYSIISPILINLLYFIINKQKKYGILILNIPIISNNIFIEFLYVLNVLYTKVEITKSIVKYENNFTIKIIASSFKNVSSNIKNNINHICKSYENSKNIYNHELIFIHSFIKNTIPKLFIKNIYSIIHYYYKNIINNTKNKIVLSKYKDNNLINYKILNEQIKTSILFNNYFNNLLNTFSTIVN